MTAEMVIITPAELAHVVGRAVDDAVARVASLLDAASHAPQAADRCDMLTAADLCRSLKVDRATLRRMELMGELPPATRIASRCVRWRRSVIEKWIADSTPEQLSIRGRCGSVRRVTRTGETT